MKDLSEKVYLYTSEDGRERCYNAETFLASVDSVRKNNVRFSVSKNYIFGNGHNKDFLVIDTGNDVEFD